MLQNHSLAPYVSRTQDSIVQITMPTPRDTTTKLGPIIRGRIPFYVPCPATDRLLLIERSKHKTICYPQEESNED